jgi:hypothetical protein
MTYNIIFMKGERILGERPWSAGLDAAKNHAQEHMVIRNADRVEVRDENGVLLFHHPRTLHGA